MVVGGDDYQGREQALVKHIILAGYLQRLAFKVGGYRPGTTLNYIDGFSGPWDATRTDLSDSSPALAMQELAKARDVLAGSGKPMKIRCLFVEKSPKAFAKLQQLCLQPAVDDVQLCNGSFEAHVDDAKRFAAVGPNPFAFIFIDPTGWKGFGLKAIAPLLQVKRSEVLVNFMLKDILRFIDSDEPKTTRSFEDLFGQEAATYRSRWASLTGVDREDAIVEAYCERLRRVGNFAHCVSTVIANPRQDRVHYRLIFATRSLKGLLTFREIEDAATPIQQEMRAAAKERVRNAESAQTELFEPTMRDSRYFEGTVNRYRARAKSAAEAQLRSAERGVSYETLVATALSHPMTAERELKLWLDEWQRRGEVEIRGLGPRERVAKVNAQHVVQWTTR